jgi:hypothetical protein
MLLGDPRLAGSVALIPQQALKGDIRLVCIHCLPLVRPDCVYICMCTRQLQELAAAAGVSDRVTYITADVLQLQCNQAAKGLWGSQDWVVMESGVLHFFLDLQVSVEVGCTTQDGLSLCRSA